jgi:hypothetical protein
MFKKCAMAFAILYILAGTAFAEMSAPLQPRNANGPLTFVGVNLEYITDGLVGFESGETGSGQGMAISYLPFRLEFMYHRLEDKGGAERKELDINTAYLGYRWSPLTFKRPGSRFYFGGLYVDTGLEVGSKEGYVARLKDPSQGWSHVGPDDIITESVQKSYVAGVVGPVLEWVAADVLIVSLSARAHLQEEDPFVAGGVSIGMRF